jgi:hypothetical protein
MNRSIFSAILFTWGASGCAKFTPLVTSETDRTGWVRIGTVMSYNVPKVNVRMNEAGIPAWCDPKGYPSYPVTTPPEHQKKAKDLIEDLLMRSL